jgi:hypothetical protein
MPISTYVLIEHTKEFVYRVRSCAVYCTPIVLSLSLALVSRINSQPGGIDSLETIPGLLKRLQIWAQYVNPNFIPNRRHLGLTLDRTVSSTLLQLSVVDPDPDLVGSGTFLARLDP